MNDDAINPELAKAVKKNAIYLVICKFAESGLSEEARQRVVTPERRR